jgi:phosphatidylglycerol:prolipoprotein diacylglycerol transferase
MINFLHTYHPKSIFFSLGPVSIHWYGFLMVLGIIGGFFIIWQLVKFYGIRKEQLFDIAFYGLIFGLIGARIYYVAYLWDYYSKNLLDILKIWQGGLAIHGIIIGGFVAIWFFARKNKLNFWLLADLVAIGLSFGQIIGRWGNYFNQELFGRPTALPWGIPIDPFNRPADFVRNEYFHPTFLYESLWNLVVFAIILGWQLVRVRKQISPPFRGGVRGGNSLPPPPTPPRAGGEGNIFFGYLILYSLGRFFIEFLRIDSMPTLWGMRWAQIMSLGIILASGIILVYRRKKK